MNAVVLGGAKSVWQELDQFEQFRVPAIVIAVNEAGRDYPGKLDFWGTLHPAKFAGWAAEREKDYVSYGRRAAAGIDHVMLDRWPGSSGLYAVQIALDVVGADRVYLCGVPMTPTAHFHSDEPWEACDGYHNGWRRALSEIAGKVKSFSGWTKELLGHPRDWHDA